MYLFFSYLQQPHLNDTHRTNRFMPCSGTQLPVANKLHSLRSLSLIHSSSATASRVSASFQRKKIGLSSACFDDVAGKNVFSSVPTE
mmetsp:Transcript_43060/g.79898  ORF Transcript_43060/g.79898 Transcript_43060/m.79898 type:complete len:87 (-) Transcript_43060:665-925(-)